MRGCVEVYGERVYSKEGVWRYVLRGCTVRGCVEVYGERVYSKRVCAERVCGGLW